jgi:hypothetical protein
MRGARLHLQIFKKIPWVLQAIIYLKLVSSNTGAYTMDKLQEITGTSKTQRRKSKILPRTSNEEAPSVLLLGRTYLQISNLTSSSMSALSGKRINYR